SHTFGPAGPFFETLQLGDHERNDRHNPGMRSTVGVWLIFRPTGRPPPGVPGRKMCLTPFTRHQTSSRGVNEVNGPRMTRMSRMRAGPLRGPLAAVRTVLRGPDAKHPGSFGGPGVLLGRSPASRNPASRPQGNPPLSPD